MAQLQSTVVSGNTNITGIVSAGARKLSMGILELNSGGTPTQFRINTTIPYSSGNADFTVNIKGFRYGNAEMTSLSIGWHFYNSEFYNRTAICNGAWAPTITLARDANGYVVIHLAGPGYWPKMYVESVYSGNYNDAYSTGWTWTDADLSNCTAAQTVPYKALSTNITGSAGSTDFNNLTNKTGGTGTYQTSGDFRAPIFYDSNDTSFFGDFASRSMMNKIEVSRNGAYGSYLDADLIVGSGAHDRRGYGQTGGSNIMLRSSAKSTITALDESQNLGQISYENLVWTIGEDIGWGNQKAYFPGDVGIGVSPISKLHVQAAVPSGVGGSPAGTIITVDNSGNNFITFRHSADNGTYAGLAFLDNNIGGYVVFGNSGANPSDSMAIAGYNGGVLQYGTANSVNPAARTTVVSWNSTGLQVNNGDLRASIFYDINDTSYYVDPNSTSRLNILTTAYLNGHYTNTSAYNSSNTLIATPSGIRSQAAFITFTDGNAIAPYAMYRTSGDWPAPYGIGWGTGGESSGIFQQYASNNYSLGDMTFYINNDGVGRFKWVMGGWEGTTYNPSGSNNYNNAVMTLDNSGNLQASASMRAPIFYDSQNTAYYLDPNSTSNLYALNVVGGQVSVGNSGVGMDWWKDGSGTYMEFYGTTTATRKLRLQGSNGSGSYAQWFIDGGNQQVYGTVADVTNFLMNSSTVYLRYNGSDKFWTGSDGTRTQGWSYYQDASAGMYWPSNGWHLLPFNGAEFRIHSGSASESSLRMETTGTIRGYFYSNSSNEIGILNNSRNWAFRTTSSNNAFIHGQTLTINADNAAWSSIYMNDGDEGMREIHCNSNRIGFLNQSGNWGAWNDDNGNWGMSLNAYMAGNRFDIQGAEGQISFKDGDNVWTGYVGFTGNLGYLSFPGRNVKINSGYNGTITLETGVSGYNDGVVSIPYGRLIVNNNYIYSGSYIEAGSNMRAPIFYDSNDTSYYLDPNSTSVLNSVIFNGILYTDNPADYWSTSITGLTNAPVSTRNFDVNVGTTARYVPLTHQTALYNSGYRTHVSTGIYKAASGWSAGWYMAIGGNDSYPTEAFFLNYGGTISHSNGYVTIEGSVRAPIFYDSNDTNYYVDPNSYSRLYRLYIGGSAHNYEASEGVILMQNNQNNHNYLVSNGAGWGSWNQWIRYVAGVNTWRIGTYDAAQESGESVWRLAGRNRSGNSELNYIVAGPRGAWGSNDRVILWNPYARYDGGSYNGDGTNYPILSTYGNVNMSGSFGLNDSRLYLRTNGDTNHYLWNASDDWEELGAYAGTGFRVTSNNGANGLLYVYGSSNGGYTYSPYSFRAPIFYDSDDTGYYLDPNSGSNLYAANFGNNSGGDQGIGIRYGNNSGGYGRIRFHQSGSNHQTIHSFSASWQGGSIWSTSAASINIEGQSGVTFGPWNASHTVIHSAGISVRNNGNLYLDYNYGQSIVGAYSSTRYQGIFAMGDSYKLAIDGTSTGTLYGLAWSHPNAGGVAGNLNTHGLLVMENGTFLAAISGSIRARDDMRAPIFYDSQNTAYYIDPNGTSNLNTLNGFYVNCNLATGRGSYGKPNANLILNATSADGAGYAAIDFRSGGNYPSDGAQIYYESSHTGSGESSRLWIRVENDAADEIYMRAGRIYYVSNTVDGGSQNPGHVFSYAANDQMYIYSDNVTATNSFRAPIFYDSNDTTYYADFANTGRSMYTAGYLQSDRMIMKGSSGGGQIYPTIAYGGMSIYGGDSLTNGAWITMTGLSYGSSPGAGSAEIIVRSETSSKIAMWTYNGSTYTGRAALWGSNGNFVIGSATTDYGYKLYVDGTIYATGNVIAYSDESVKTNVREIENPLARVLNTRGVIYDRIDNEEKDNIGFIAQELEKEFPELVSTGNNGKKGVMYQNMVAVLIEAMKEQNKEIQKLKMLINGASR